MGYYTQYSLTVTGIPDEQTKNALVKYIDSLWWRSIFDQCPDDNRLANDTFCLEYYPIDEAKWYQCEDDIAGLSKQFPQCYFKLHGDGEDTFDIWDCYFKDGDKELCPVEIIEPKPVRIKWPDITYQK